MRSRPANRARVRLAGGQMPTLDHLSNADIKELWSFRHSVHKGAVK